MARRKSFRFGFTLVELLVVVSVMTILASLALPAIGSSLKQANGLECRSNLGQIGKACFMYSTQYSQYLPCYGKYAGRNPHGRSIAPPSLLLPYLQAPEIFVCPSDPTPENCVWWRLEHPGLEKSSYMWSEHVMTWSRGAVPVENYRDPHEVGLVADGWECPNAWTWLTCLPPRLYAGSRIDWEHGRGVNLVFADQHVEKVKHEKLEDVRSDPR